MLSMPSKAEGGSLALPRRRAVLLFLSLLANLGVSPKRGVAEDDFVADSICSEASGWAAPPGVDDEGEPLALCSAFDFRGEACCRGDWRTDRWDFSPSVEADFRDDTLGPLGL